MDFEVGQRVYVPGLGLTGEVAELIPGLNVVRFRADVDGLVRAVDASAVSAGNTEKARAGAKGKARKPGPNKAAGE